MKALAAAVTIAAALAGSAQAQTLTVTGLIGRKAALTAADVAALPHVSVSTDNHGEKHVFEGPLISSVLAKVDAPFGAGVRGKALAVVVLSKSTDGYVVAFTLAETDYSLRKDRVILADHMDGKPLPAADGAFRLVFEGDERPARSARLVESLELQALAGPIGSPR